MPVPVPVSAPGGIHDGRRDGRVTGTPPRVLVIDPCPVGRSRLCIRLSRSGMSVLGDADAGALDAMIAAFDPDLAIVDSSRRSAVDVVRTVLAGSNAAVVVVAAPDTTAVDRIAAIDAGAADVVDDRCGPDELTARVLTLLRQRRRAAVLQFADVVVDEHAHVACRGGRPIDLTATEFALLVALVRDAGLVLSKRQLLRSVWGFDGYDGNVVEVHISALRRKLEQHGPRLIHTVRSLGYVARHTDPPLSNGHSAAAGDGRRLRVQTSEPTIATPAAARYQP
jgi:DNA-binding response OmpR family regulator